MRQEVRGNFVKLRCFLAGFILPCGPRRDEDGVVKIPVEDIKTSPTEIHFVEDIQELNRTLAHGSDAEYRLTSPLQVDITHMRSGKDLIFTGAIAGQLVSQCGRCLEECVLPIRREFSLVLSPERTLGREVELNADELSASFYSEDKVDLSALVHEETFLALPSQPLCREDCRGLCPQCGTNLNLEPCECRPVWRDPRLAVLATLRVPPQG